PLPIAADHAQEADALKQWLQKRMNWLDQRLTGPCSPWLGIAQTQLDLNCSISPNPFSDQLTIAISEEGPKQYTLSILALDGRVVMSREFTARGAGHKETIFTGDVLAPGMCLVKISSGTGARTFKLLKHQ